MAHPFLNKALTLFGRNRARTASPTKTVGKPGTRISSGYIASEERNRLLVRESRYRVGSEMLANSSIVAASVRLYLDLVGRSRWVFDGTDEAVERAETALMEDPATPWHRIARRASFSFYWGYSIQEWTMMRRAEDGALTFKDIAPRAQRTIERWDVDKQTGAVLGVVQRDPNTYDEIYIPRSKCLYMVDDSMDDSPEGLGMFRHLIERYLRLVEYEKLEWSNFEDVALGTLIAMLPFAELERLVAEAGEQLTNEGRVALEAPLKQLLQDRVEGKGKRSGIAIDSSVYQGVTIDRENRPTSARQWGVDRLRSETGGLGPFNNSINRLNLELARVMGTEQLLLGGSGGGSYALSADQSHNFMLKVDGTNREIAETVKSDLLLPLWLVNGWDLKTIPDVTVETVRFKDFEALARMLKDLAASGAVLSLDDPAINEIRAEGGLSPYDAPDPDEIGSSLMGGDKGSNVNEGEVS